MYVHPGFGIDCKNAEILNTLRYRCYFHSCKCFCPQLFLPGHAVTYLRALVRIGSKVWGATEWFIASVAILGLGSYRSGIKDNQDVVILLTPSRRLTCAHLKAVSRIVLTSDIMGKKQVSGLLKISYPPCQICSFQHWTCWSRTFCSLVLLTNSLYCACTIEKVMLSCVVKLSLLSEYPGASYPR